MSAPVKRAFGLPINRYVDPEHYGGNEEDIDPRMLVLYECPVCGCIEQREGMECFGYPGVDGEGHEDTEMVAIRVFREEPVRKLYDALASIHEQPVREVYGAALAQRAAGPWPDDWKAGTS